jgi:hypothetical protein
LKVPASASHQAIKHDMTQQLLLLHAYAIAFTHSIMAGRKQSSPLVPDRNIPVH